MAQRHDPDLYHTRSPLPIRLIERRRVSVLVKLLNPAPSHRVLEVGCGAGNVLERVPRGTRVGIDLSEFLLSKAVSRLGGVAELLRMNAERLAFSDDSFDRVYCTEVLEHVLDPTAVVAEMRRVLRPDGIAVVTVPNESLINRLKGTAFSLPGMRRVLAKKDGYDMPEHMEDEWHLHEFDAERLQEVTRQFFEIELLRGIPSRWLPLRWVARLSPLA